MHTHKTNESKQIILYNRFVLYVTYQLRYEVINHHVSKYTTEKGVRIYTATVSIS